MANRAKKIKKIKIGGQIIEAELCDTILSRARGLMFRKKPKVLLFEFKKPARKSIHSFFCKPFHAIWLRNGKIIDEKIVKPFSFYKSKKPVTHLVEIPLQNNNKHSEFIVGNRKI